MNQAKQCLRFISKAHVDKENYVVFYLYSDLFALNKKKRINYWLITGYKKNMNINSSRENEEKKLDEFEVNENHTAFIV